MSRPPKAIAMASSWEWTCPICQEENESEDIPLNGTEIECDHCENPVYVVMG
jgi:hypothetical protein